MGERRNEPERATKQKDEQSMTGGIVEVNSLQKFGKFGVRVAFFVRCKQKLFLSKGGGLNEQGRL